MKYKQLTEGDRYSIAALKMQSLSFTDIAKAISRDRSTIYGEVTRNNCWRQDGSYRTIKAQRRTIVRRSRSKINTLPRNNTSLFDDYYINNGT